MHDDWVQCRRSLARTQATAANTSYEASLLREDLCALKRKAGQQGAKIKQVQQAHRSELQQAALDHESTLSELEKDMWCGASVEASLLCHPNAAAAASSYVPAVCSGKCVHISAQLLQGLMNPTMVAERLHAQKLPADAMVYAFTRANVCGTLPYSLLRALHSKLHQDASGDRQSLNLFYETWQLEHRMCRPQGYCPIPIYHDWACQMRGQQLQHLENASNNISGSEVESE